MNLRKYWPLVVEVSEKSVRIWTKQKLEVVMWIQEEWEEDPSCVPAIANAISMAYTQPAKLLDINRKHVESQEREQITWQH